MSFLDKVNVGIKNKKYTHNLSGTTSTTTNIGRIAPTFSKFLPKDSKVTISNDSLVRLLAMTAPTFGSMSLRHYFKFVPIKDLYLPYDELISDSPFLRNGQQFIPTAVPTFRYVDLLNFVFSLDCICTLYEFSDQQQYARDYRHLNAVKIEGSEGGLFGFPSYFDVFSLNNVSSPYPHRITDVSSYWCSPQILSGVDGTNYPLYFNIFNRFSFDASRSTRFIQPGRDVDALSFYPFYQIKGDQVQKYNLGFTSSDLVSVDNADYLLEIYFRYDNGGVVAYKRCVLAVKFGPMVKHLREIMIGLGYQFNLTSTQERNVFKLLAYSKSIYDTFFPQRDTNFSQTKCYQFIDAISESGAYRCFIDDFDKNYFFDMLYEMLQNSYYYLSADYFSASQPDVIMRPENESTISITSKTSLTTIYDQEDFAVAGDVTHPTTQQERFDTPRGGTSINGVVQKNGYTSALAMKMALKLLPFVNKNSVIGRSVANYLKAHFGVVGDLNEQERGAINVGAARVNIQINPLMNMAESQDAYLGEFAATGIGRGQSDTFTFNATSHGVLICFSVIVPDTSYYQGTLRENSWIKKFDFPTPEFDCLGWQLLTRDELKDDYNVSVGELKDTLINNDRGFGLLPRYSEIKVGRDIINGDLSLPSLYSQMGAYTLARHIPSKITEDGIMRAPTGVGLVSVPFRQIGNESDLDGDYNRIFAYGRNDIDHFMINIVFKCKVSMPYKPLKNSFDTFESDDNDNIDVNKL